MTFIEGSESNSTLEVNRPSFFEDGHRVEFDQAFFDAGLYVDNGPVMMDALPHLVRQFGCVTLEPSFGGVVLATPDMAVDYCNAAHIASRGHLDVLVPVRLNTGLTENDIKQIAHDPQIIGVKFYPASVTSSESGLLLRNPLDAPDQLGWMEEHRVPLLIHGQVRTLSDGRVLDPYCWESRFFETVAPQLDKRYPNLRISYQQLSTGIGAQTVAERKGPTFGTFTPLHLRYTRTDVLSAGVRVDMLADPVIQPARELSRLWESLRSRPDRFGLGSGDTWHPVKAGHANNCPSGVCHGPYTLAHCMYVFDINNALPLFPGFAGQNAAEFYGVEVHPKRITMQRGLYEVPESLKLGDDFIKLFRSGETIRGWHPIEA